MLKKPGYEKLIWLISTQGSEHIKLIYGKVPVTVRHLIKLLQVKPKNRQYSSK